MASALDERMDAALAAITGPNGPVAAEGDGIGRMSPAALPQTLPGFLDLFCTLHADKPALVAGDERLSFAELGAWIDRVARALVVRGVLPGNRVAIAMPNAPTWIILYFAILKAGGVATLLNGWWEVEEVASALDMTTPVLVLADAERRRRCRSAATAPEVIELPIARPIAEALAPLLDGVEVAADLPIVTPEHDATILFTSGSTGRAKGAVSTHAAVTTGAYTYLSYSAALYALIVAERGEPPFGPAILVAVPLFHVTGMVPVLLNSIAIGRKLVLMRKWDAGEALRLIEAERITYFVGVPTMSLEMMQHPDRESRDLASLADIAAGGAARPVAHVARLAAAFPQAHPMLGYGLTETNAVGCTNYRESYIERPGSTGRAHHPWGDVAILDAAGAALSQGRTGEIGIRSRANIRGYWNDTAATAAAITADGYVRTGDLGFLDPEGYLFIVDRAKEIIIRGGENISCIEVEAALYAHPDVREAAVFGVADERLGEVPAAVLVTEPGTTLDRAALDAFLAERLARFKRPALLWFAEGALPRLGTGKFDKAALRAIYRAEPETAAALPAT